MMNTLGKHTNDQMVSFYVYSPESYAIECRLERPARHRGAPDLRDHPGRLLGPQVHAAAERRMTAPHRSTRDSSDLGRIRAVPTNATESRITP